MQRRTLLKLTGLLGAAVALPGWGRSLTSNPQSELPIPELLQADADNKIVLRAQTGRAIWRGKQVATWGYNGDILGPTLMLEKGKKMTIQIDNHLPEATTVHWHGLAIPGEVDGGPHNPLQPGERRVVTFTPDQPASTCWYHPHLHGKTGFQVAKGLSGLILLKDEAVERLRLPRQWGIDDLPIILQDKQLTAKGNNIDYQLDLMSAAVGWFGDLMLTNGTLHPQKSVPRGWVRLRLLNGCNARALTIATSDKRSLYVIASDGGLLPEPVRLEEISLLPGERFEVLINTQDGRSFELLSLPVKQMGMTLPPFDQPLPLLTIHPLRVLASGTLPDSLSTLPPLPELSRLPERRLQLTMDERLDSLGMSELMRRYGHQAMAGMNMSHHNTHGQMHSTKSSAHYDFRSGNKINGKAFDISSPAFDVPRGKYEKWIISGEGDAMLHPFHIHGTQFRVLLENGKPPAVHRRGWKDIVKIEGGISEVLVRFEHSASAEHAYMAHCHILEHEDTGMMAGFTVT